MPTIDDYIKKIKNRLPIDQFNLNEECIKQPDLYADVGILAAELRDEARKSKDLFDNTCAELKTDIRNDPEKFGIKKVTEGSIAETLILCEKYNTDQDIYREADLISNKVSVLLAAVEQRKSLLRDLISLYIHSYYSDENKKPIAGGERDRITDIAEEEIGKSRGNRD